MVVAKKSSAQMDQRNFPIRVFRCSAASAAPMALVPPDCDAAVDSDLGSAVASTDLDIWSIFGVRRLDAAFSCLEFRRQMGGFSKLIEARAQMRSFETKRRQAGALQNHWFTPLARNPPSTTIISPVTKLAASEARKIAAPASSSTFPNRFIGELSSNSRPRSVSSSNFRFRSVRKKPGAIAFTQTPCGAHSIASDFVRAPMAALLAP